MKEEGVTSLARYKFENYVKEIYYDSDTNVALLSGAPFDDPSWWLLSNEQIVKARELINNVAGSRRLLAHSVITPKQPGWMEEVDKAIERLQARFLEVLHDRRSAGARPKFPWRLDDEQLMYPFYEKAVKAGINTLCIHKGLLPPDYEKSFAGVWEYATTWDIRKAAKDWPQMNFVIYHSALRAFLEQPDNELGGVRADRPHPLGDRSRGNPAEIRRHQRLCRARHVLCELGGSAIRSSAPRWSAR